MILFALGIIIGILVRDIKFETIKKIEIYKENQENKGSTEFYEPISDQEKWNNAESVDDLLN